MDLEYLFYRQDKELFPETEELEALLRRLYARSSIQFTTDDPNQPSAGLPDNPVFDDMREYLAHNRPAMGWIITHDELTFGGLLERHRRTIVLRADRDSIIAEHAIHLARGLGKGIYALDFVMGDTFPAYLVVGAPPGTGPTAPAIAEPAGVFQLPPDGQYDNNFLRRFVPAMRRPQPEPEGSGTRAEERYYEWSDVVYRQLVAMPGYGGGGARYQGTFFLTPHDTSLSVTDAAQRFFAALEHSGDYREFADDKGDYWYGRYAFDGRLELNCAARYDHPDFMFKAHIELRLGEYPEAAQWGEDQLLDMTLERVGYAILAAGFRLVVDHYRKFFDYTSFPALEYYLDTDGNGQQVVKLKEIMMVKSRPRP